MNLRTERARERKALKEAMKVVGQVVVTVATDAEDVDAFSYTLGNTEVGLPEFMLRGASGEEAARILNIVAAEQRALGRALTPGDTLVLGRGLTVEISQPDEFLSRRVYKVMARYLSKTSDGRAPILNEVRVSQASRIH